MIKKLMLKQTRRLKDLPSSLVSCCLHFAITNKPKSALGFGRFNLTALVRLAPISIR